MSEFCIDRAEQRLWNGDRPVPLTRKAFALLRLFTENQNRLLTKDQILDAVWGKVNVSEGLVKEYVHDPRAALGDDPNAARFIETVRGRGYRYLGGIAECEGQAAAPSSRTAAESMPSLAVLPFRNLSSGPGSEYFSDGVTEDIIIGLSKVPHLLVIANYSTRPDTKRHWLPSHKGRLLAATYAPPRPDAGGTRRGRGVSEDRPGFFDIGMGENGTLHRPQRAAAICRGPQEGGSSGVTLRSLRSPSAPHPLPP